MPPSVSPLFLFTSFLYSQTRASHSLICFADCLLVRRHMKTNATFGVACFHFVSSTLYHVKHSFSIFFVIYFAVFFAIFLVNLLILFFTFFLLYPLYKIPLLTLIFSIFSHTLCFTILDFLSFTYALQYIDWFVSRETLSCVYCLYTTKCFT